MNLSTSYLGLSLPSPLIVGASPCCDDLYLARKFQDAGAGALVLRSLFQEQLASRPDGGPLFVPNPDEIADYPELAEYQFDPESYVRHVAALKRQVSIPVIASLNVARPGPWIDFAARLEGAGADAIELNFYRVVTDVSLAADLIETEILESVGQVTRAVRIPVAVKLSPFHTAMAQFVVALEVAGASGVVLFNRFYQPDVDTSLLQVRPRLQLSHPSESLLRLRWLAILSPERRASLAATGGFHSTEDVLKALLTGADAVQLVSVLLRYGPPLLSSLVLGIEAWMKEHGCTRLDQFRGMLNLRGCRDAGAFERANYVQVLQSWKV